MVFLTDYRLHSILGEQEIGAEVAVKAGKRLVMDNLAANGSLDTDRLARALRAHRNLTDLVSGLSPSQVIFGRQL